MRTSAIVLKCLQRFYVFGAIVPYFVHVVIIEAFGVPFSMHVVRSSLQWLHFKQVESDSNTLQLIDVF